MPPSVQSVADVRARPRRSRSWQGQILPPLAVLLIALSALMVGPVLPASAATPAPVSAASGLTATQARRADPGDGTHSALPDSQLNELPSASAFEAQAKLIPRLRQFYGGSGALRGLLPILMLMVGPLKVIPAFFRLTARASEPMRRSLAWNSFLLATATVLVLALFGYRLLVNFNIPLTAILASAGLILVLVALRLVLAQYEDDGLHDDHPDDHDQGQSGRLSPPPPPANPGLDLVVQPLVFPIILTPYGLAVVITLSALVRELEGSPATLMLILVLIMVLNLLAMLFARPILAVIRPRVLQMLGLVLGIIQLALGIGLLFTAVEVQALAIRELLR